MSTYKGIRYAKAERFGLPQLEPALASVDNIETAIKICPQNPSRLTRVIGRSGDTEEQSEDCLRLSVFYTFNYWRFHKP